MIGKRGLALLKSCEECELNAYDDGYGVWTIGWGHTKEVKEGDQCTQDQADSWLREDLREAEMAVDDLVNVALTETQRDALIVFTYNIGRGGFAGSDALVYLNKGDYHSACKAFLGWTRAQGKRSRGLLIRRLKEGLLFAEDPWPKQE